MVFTIERIIMNAKSIFATLASCGAISLSSAYAADFTISKVIVNKEGQFLTSYPGIELPEGMVVQGSEVHYKITIPEDSPLNAESTRFKYSFKHKRGNVEFLNKQGNNRNHFKADWYGENIVTITAKDMKSGLTKSAEDIVFCQFASRRVLGGDAESLPESHRKNIRRGNLHDLRKAGNKGMAYLPEDYSRGDSKSEQIKQGFFETTEPRIFQTAKGTLITATQARRIGKNDAPTGQAIVIKRSLDEGATWVDGMLLDQHGEDVWGYSALVEVDGTLYCYAVAGHPGHQDANNEIRGIYYYTSTDEGKTWSKRKRHDELSAGIGIELGKKIPSGASPNCNILVVPGMTLDGEKAPAGQGLLFSTYAHGYLWASINGGKNWSMVADHKYYANAKENGLGKPVQIENELGWSILDNKDGDIYMIWRRQAFTGFKNEYIVSKHFKTGPDGMLVKEVYNQELGNIPARRCHFGQRTITVGPHKGQVLVASQGTGSRNHIQLYRTKQAIGGSQTISSGMYQMATIMKGIAWGYCDLEYLSANHPAYKDMGQDAIILFGESEPVHKQTHQYISLAPNGKGKDERYTATTFIFSNDYYDFLLQGSTRNLKDNDLSFEPNQGWLGFASQKSPHKISKTITDKAGNRWGDGKSPLYLYNREDVARSGTQCLVIGGSTSANESFSLFPAKAVKTLSFQLSRFSSNSSTLTLTVEQKIAGRWQSAFQQSYSGDDIPSEFTKISVALKQRTAAEIRIGVKGAKGFLIDDFTL